MFAASVFNLCVVAGHENVAQVDVPIASQQSACVCFFMFAALDFFVCVVAGHENVAQVGVAIASQQSARVCFLMFAALDFFVCVAGHSKVLQVLPFLDAL